MKMNHVGILVGDMDKAFEFYTKALGLEIVMGNTKVEEERETAIGKMCVAVFREGFKGFNIAHLVTTDGIGLETHLATCLSFTHTPIKKLTRLNMSRLLPLRRRL